jgi:MoaE-MoaD fusion protein
MPPKSTTPPVTPPSTDAASHPDDLRLVHSPLHIHEITAALRAPSDGALVVFDGFVRDNFHGRRTTHLEYTAYEPMALAKIREIAALMREKFPINRIAIVHRLGRLEVGETSIAIAVSAAHRAAAFDAARFAIDTLKRTVPIWKKEFFADGSVWADGETPHSPNSSSSTPATANSSSGESDS